MNTSLKRVWAGILALAMVLSLAACSREEEPSSEPVISSLTPSSSAASEPEEEEEAATPAYSEGLTENGYFEGVTGLDYVTLPDYKNLSIPEDVSTVTDEEFEEELNIRMQGYSTTAQITDRAVEDGDIVNIDYVGSVDGVEFSGGSTGGAGTTVTAGSTQYIDDFLIQIIGRMPGETFDVNVTFPENYGVEDLNGKDAVFVTTINYIQEDVNPEYNDEFVYSNWYDAYGWSNVEEASEGIRTELLNDAVSNYLWEEIQSEAEVSEDPSSLFDYQVKILESYYTAIAGQYGMSLEDFITTNLQLEDIDALIDQNRSALNTNARASLVMQALSEDMGIVPTDEDIAEYFREAMSVSDYSDYEAAYGRPYLALLTREYMAKKILAEME